MWLNMHFLGGAGSEVVIDGIEYSLTECDDISVFADRGVYLGIVSGRMPNPDAFILDEETGEISPNAAFDGINILFNLPLDPALADPVRSQQYLDALFEEW